MLLQMENDLVVFLFFIYGIVATCFFFSSCRTMTKIFNCAMFLLLFFIKQKSIKLQVSSKSK